ncbi:MAG: hypothetical protein K9G33_01210 [Sneathiella sp.]|nr:hypothetical protein [Sneathiella sp.]
MTDITTIGLDLAKTVFQVHGADKDGRPVLRKKLRRGQVLGFFAAIPSSGSGWRPAAVLITGRASCRRLVMRYD